MFSFVTCFYSVLFYSIMSEQSLHTNNISTNAYGSLLCQLLIEDLQDPSSASQIFRPRLFLLGNSRSSPLLSPTQSRSVLLKL